MNKKDIALTVGGILATMILAYVFYKRQQDQAAAATTTQTTQAQDINNPDYYDQAGLYDASAAYLAGYQLSSLSTPSYSSITPSSTTAGSADTSATTAAGFNDEADMNTLLTDFFSSYMQQAGQSNAADFSALAIPALNMTNTGLDTSNIPVTAAQANAGAGGTLSVSGVTGGAVPPPSTQPVSDTAQAASATSNTHYNHIVAVGQE